MALRAHHFVALLGIQLILFLSSSSSTILVTPSTTVSKASIKWDLQFNTSLGLFQSVSMCKGTTDKTSKVGFIAGRVGSIWRTLDGVNWQQVADFNFTNSANWGGIYCFPDAQRVIAVGFTDLSDNHNGAVISWSFDGGNTWTKLQPMPHTGEYTWPGSVYFYNDTHGFILPATQDGVPLVYYTTNGGRTASDWQVGNPDGNTTWLQSHPTWVFGDVIKTLAVGDNGPELCYTEDTGMTWSCDMLNQLVFVGSFVTLNDAIGVDYQLNIKTTNDGGLNWKSTSSLPVNLANAMQLPSDLLWIPNSDVVILVGGDNRVPAGTVVHSMDRGLTWTQSLPELPPISFYSIDSVAVSPTITEVWVVGVEGTPFTGLTSFVVHGTITFG